MWLGTEGGDAAHHETSHGRYEGADAGQEGDSLEEAADERGAAEAALAAANAELTAERGSTLKVPALF